MQTKTTTHQSSVEIPEDICCPITYEIMAEPVVLAATGQTYEREAILMHLKNKQTDPLSGLAISDTRIVPNHLAKKLIASFLDQQRAFNPDIVNEVYLPSSWGQTLITALEKNEITLFKETLKKDSRLLHKNLKDNKTIFRLACELGSLESLKIVVTALGDKVRETEKKTETMRLLSKAQLELGICYYYGDEVAKNLTQAVKYYHLAADQGLAEAQFNLGVCYYRGKGVAKNLTQAVKYFRLAMNQEDDPLTQLNLAKLLENDPELRDQVNAPAHENFLTSPNSSASSIPTTTTATTILTNTTMHSTNTTPESGKENAIALFKLGNYYRKGREVARDLTRAAKYYHLAADQGLAEAQFNLGLSYYKGEGVTRNLPQAAKYFHLAATQGIIAAQANLTILLEENPALRYQMTATHQTNFWTSQNNNASSAQSNCKQTLSINSIPFYPFQ